MGRKNLQMFDHLLEDLNKINVLLKLLKNKKVIFFPHKVSIMHSQN